MPIAIYDDYELIYLGCTKCAQTIMFYALGQLLGSPRPGEDKEVMMPLSYYTVSNPGYKTSTIIRNPWDRMVSYIYYRSRRMDVVDFNSQIRSDHELWGNLEHPVGIEAQTKYLDVPLSEIDFVLRYENFTADFDAMCIKLGVSYDSRPIDYGPNQNRSRGRPQDYRSVYDKDTEEIVADLFADDIKILGYEF